MMRVGQPQEPVGERIMQPSEDGKARHRITRAGFKPNSSTVPERYIL